MKLYTKLNHNGSDRIDWAVFLTPSIMIGNLVYTKGYELTIRWIVFTFRLVIELEEL